VSSRAALTLLKTTSKSASALPDDYDSMLRAGWARFLDDMEQREAGARTRIRLTVSQRAVLKRLMGIARSTEPIRNREMVDALYAAFSIPRPKGKLNRELNHVRKAELGNEQFIDALSEIYRNFELQKNVEQREKESEAPRIVYSAYVGD